MKNIQMTQAHLLRETYKGIKIQTAMRQTLIKIFNSQQAFNLHITLNSFADYNVNTIMAKTRYWEKDILSRLFRKKANAEQTKKDFIYYGFLEFTQQDEPHYHLLAYIIPNKQDWFIKTVPMLWQKQITSGQCYIQQRGNIKSTEKSALVQYVTKDLAKPIAYEHFICFGRRSH